MGTKRPSNPFYAALVVIGIAFSVTACAYMVMTVRGLKPADPAQASSLITFVERHGFLLLMVELGLLAVATVLAMVTDDYWTRRDGAD